MVSLLVNRKEDERLVFFPVDELHIALASLFEIWQTRGLNPFDECLRLFSQGVAS